MTVNPYAALFRIPHSAFHIVVGGTMADRQLTKESQAGTLRSWMLGLHATHIIDIGGRLGYFAELNRQAERPRLRN